MSANPYPSTVYLISDSTGQTVDAIADAGLSLFPGHRLERRQFIFIRSVKDVDRVVTCIESGSGIAIITMVDPDLRAYVIDQMSRIDVKVIPILEPVIKALESHLGRKAEPRMGGQHQVNDLYYNRVDAIDYAIRNDDGALADRISEADVILTGVSRTSKTPTCIYLAMRGIKAANVPLIPEREPPVELFDAVKAEALIVGLTASPNRLAQIRRQRLETLGHDGCADYAAPDHVRKEVADARLLFDRLGATVIDVTRRSIEETAAEILALLRDRSSR